MTSTYHNLLQNCNLSPEIEKIENGAQIIIFPTGILTKGETEIYLPDSKLPHSSSFEILEIYTNAKKQLLFVHAIDFPGSNTKLMIIILCPTKEQFEKALDQAEDMMLAIEDNQFGYYTEDDVQLKQ